VNWPAPERWADLWRAIGIQAPMDWYERLKNAYAEPHRHYHNQQHIADCLFEFDQARQLALDPEAMELALWFHDAVYDTRATDNEEKSAALARSCLTEAGANRVLIENVTRLVMATKTHEPASDRDAALMIDIDLSILGQNQQRFSEYERQIRQEYRWVPQFIFATKRSEILKQFLAREQIFATEWFREKYENQARRNLGWSLGNLNK
jgi:predicted metal-dependent HD superfamily phosphohydrolase